MKGGKGWGRPQSPKIMSATKSLVRSSVWDSIYQDLWEPGAMGSVRAWLSNKKSPRWQQRPDTMAKGHKKRLVRAVPAIAVVQEAVVENPQQSMRQLARWYSMDPRTLRNLVRRIWVWRALSSSSSRFWPQMLKKWGREGAANSSESQRPASLIKSRFCWWNDLHWGSGHQPPQQLLLDGPPCGRHGLQNPHLSLFKAPLKQMVYRVGGSDGPSRFCWRWRTSQLRWLLGYFAASCGPLGLEDVAGQQLCLLAGLGPGPHPQDQPGLLDWKHGGIFTGPGPAGLLYLERVAGEGPGDSLRQSGRLASVRHQRLGPPVATYICQTYCFFRSCLEAVMAKNASILNRWAANRPTHTKQPFSGLLKASIRDEYLYIGRKNILVHDWSPHPVYAAWTWTCSLDMYFLAYTWTCT